YLPSSAPKAIGSMKRSVVRTSRIRFLPQVSARILAARGLDRLARLGDASGVIANLEESRGRAMVSAMRPLLICALGALAVVLGASAGSGAAQVQGSPTRVLVNTGDHFDVTGTRIACRVVRKAATSTNR